MKQLLSIISLLIVFFLAHLNAFAEEPVCSQDGILVRNLTLDDLWYKKDQELCTILKRNKNFIIKPENIIYIFSDMN